MVPRSVFCSPSGAVSVRGGGRGAVAEHVYAVHAIRPDEICATEVIWTAKDRAEAYAKELSYGSGTGRCGSARTEPSGRWTRSETPASAADAPAGPRRQHPCSRPLPVGFHNLTEWGPTTRKSELREEVIRMELGGG